MSKYIQNSLFVNQKNKTRINSHIGRIKEEFSLIKKIFGKEYLINKVISQIENIQYEELNEIIEKYDHLEYKEKIDLIIIDGYLDEKIKKENIKIIKNYHEIDN